MARREVGAVVIGRNEGDRLIRCLKSLAGRVNPIIYVDSGSSDGSPAAAQQLGAVVIGLDLDQPFTAARARNAGFESLAAANPEVELVQFVDGDCELAPGWFDASLAVMDSNDIIAAVCGRRLERYPEASVFNRLCDIEWNTPVGDAEACGGDSLMRVAAVASVGGFRSDLMAGEEPELCGRLREQGWKIRRIDADMTLHDAAMTSIGQWWRRSVRGGFGYAQVWTETKSRHHTLYRKEVMRAIAWGGLLPVAILMALAIKPLLGLLGLAIYPLQISRIALRRGGSRSESWIYAVFSVLAKFPELQGVTKFWSGRRRHARTALIEYK